MQKNPVCFWELASHDAEESVAFFEKVFEWQAQYDDRIGIYEFPAEEGANSFFGGGVFTLRRAKLPFLTVYIRVEDIETKAKRVDLSWNHQLNSRQAQKYACSTNRRE